MKNYLPILDWLPKYQKSYLKGDISAGLTIGIMLIPQGMAYAMVAGLPPIYGLYASLIPQIVYILMGTSRQLSFGPVATDSLIVATGVSLLAQSDSPEYIALVILLAFFTGVFQFLFGVLGLGFIVNFLSKPVISGFTLGAALIIGLNQFSSLMRVDVPSSNQAHVLLYHIFLNIAHIHWITLAIGLGGIFLLVFVKKIHKSIPTPFLVVILAIALVYGMHLDKQGVQIIKDIPSGFPLFEIPIFQTAKLSQLLPIALTLALIGFMEAISIGKTLQAKHKNYEVNANQELRALGLANLSGAFFQSFPVTGSFSRSAVNDQAGAKTGVASLVSVGLIALTLLFLTPLFYYLPKAILASIILTAVINLMDIKYPRFLWKTKKEEFWMLLITFGITASVGVREGIMFGVILSLVLVIYQTTRPHVAVLGCFPDTKEYRNVGRFAEVITRPDILIVRYDASLYFANIQHFKDTMQTLIKKKGEALKLILLNAESINTIDASAVEMLNDFMQDLRKNGMDLYFSGVKGPVRDIFYKAEWMPVIGENHLFLEEQEAIDFYDHKETGWVSKSGLYAQQTNVK
jgi:sulfate permease, SulP family